MVTNHAYAGFLIALTAVLGACSSDSETSDGGAGTSAAGSTAAGAAGSSGSGAGTAGSAGGGLAGASGSSGQSGAAGATAGGAGASGSSGQSGTAGVGGASAGAAGEGGAAGEAGQAGGGAGGAAAGASGEAGAGGSAGGAAGGAGMSGGSGQGGATTCDETQVGTVCATGLPGVCGAGKLACVASKLTCVADIKPGDQGEQCNGLDDDCNGEIDDLDVGGDGICDCLSIGLLGMPGPLSSANFQAWLEARGTSVKRIQDTEATKSQPLDATALGQFDVLIVDKLLREYTADEAAAVQTWVKDKGRGVVTMTGYADNPNPDFYPNALLAPFGFAYTGSVFNGPLTSFAVHPVTEGLTSVTFNGGYVISSTPITGATSTPIAFHPNGNVAFAHEQGKGRVLVWGDEWIEYDSEWSTLPEIERLWVNIMNWTGPRDTCQVPKP